MSPTHIFTLQSQPVVKYKCDEYGDLSNDFTGPKCAAVFVGREELLRVNNSPSLVPTRYVFFVLPEKRGHIPNGLRTVVRGRCQLPVVFRQQAVVFAYNTYVERLVTITVPFNAAAQVACHLGTNGLRDKAVEHGRRNARKRCKNSKNNKINENKNNLIKRCREKN